MFWRVIELQQLSRGTMPRGPRAALSWFSTLQYATTTPIQVLALGVPESPELGLLGCARASKGRARPLVGRARTLLGVQGVNLEWGLKLGSALSNHRACSRACVPPRAGVTLSSGDGQTGI